MRQLDQKEVLEKNTCHHNLSTLIMVEIAVAFER
jgi:hypothetical protein